MFWKKGRGKVDDLSQDRILEVLKQVKDPSGESNIVDKGLVGDISILQGRVVFSIKVPAEQAPKLEGMRKAAEKVVSVLPGVEKVMAALTAERVPGQPAAPSSTPPLTGGGSAPSGPAATAASGKTGSSAQLDVPGISKIIAVASGKGGVGKSTTSVNLALALSELGLRVGLLDADIYGPSIPKLMGVSGKPEVLEGRVMKPMEAYGIKLMSIGFLVDEETAMIWRGPMVTSALNQMLREVAWGELDVLVVDMPPGTGDVQLTMAQKVPLTGSVIVSTPQDLALLDARRGTAMFQKVSIPVIGIIENMSHFICPDCGSRHEIFGHGGAREEAQKLQVPFLGEIPLTMELRVQSDQGRPVVIAHPESAVAQAYLTIAEHIRTSLETGEAGLSKPAPRIVIE